jgi:LacI family repressor for deo operon, udp, cdd, tsx, nupC, and nupG
MNSNQNPSRTSNRKKPSPPRYGEVPTISKSNKTPTIVEFAEAIGVSATTVSRAITQRGRISNETRQMVLQRMEELNYTPNLHAQRLIWGRTSTVALCIGSLMAPATDPFLAGLIRGLQQALQANDYALLLLGRGDGIKRWVDSRAVDGVIVMGGSEEDASVARSIVRPQVPCVVIGTTALEVEPHMGSVFIDLASSGVKVARALFKSGHRRIGFIGSNYSQGILPFFRGELEHLGVPLCPEYTVIAGDTPEAGERAMYQLLSLPTAPTAVFARNDELAIGAVRAARKQGVQVPKQISIIGHDDLAFARFIDPPLSTVRIDCDAVGKAVVNMLFDLLAHPDTPFVPRSVATELVMRETIAPPEFSSS